MEWAALDDGEMGRRGWWWLMEARMGDGGVVGGPRRWSKGGLWLVMATGEWVVGVGGRRGLVMKELVHGIQGIDDEDDAKWRETLGMGVAGGVLGGAAGGCGQRQVGRWPLGGLPLPS
ncbi:hypothetical protein Dimus_027270 [Dionaea muscipula]